MFGLYMLAIYLGVAVIAGLVIAAITGTAGAIEGPSRSAFVSEMVPTARLANAVADAANERRSPVTPSRPTE